MTYLNIGIDVAKHSHEACLVNEDGKQIGRYIRIENSKSSVESFRTVVESVAKELNAVPRVGMEATGIYWYQIYNALSDFYKVNLYNPSQIKGFSLVNIRGTKTDKIDAKTIANMLRFGEAPKTSYDDKNRIEMKEYVRFHFKLKSEVINFKRRFLRNVHMIFPGYDQFFSNVFGKTSKAILSKAPTPTDLLEIEEEELFELMKEKSRNHFGRAKTRELIGIAKDAITSDSIEKPIIFELEVILKLIDEMENQIEETEKRILAIWDKVSDKHYLQTIPGITKLKAAMIWAEIGDIENFSHPDQIVAFAGFDPKVKKSGNKEVISGPNKRGSRVLRCIIGRAVVDAKRANPVIGQYFNKKISEGKHYNTARCAAAKKLIRIIWSVEKNKKPFQIPE
jgi:transposase